MKMIDLDTLCQAVRQVIREELEAVQGKRGPNPVGLLTPKEASALLGIDERTLRRLRAQGALRPVMIGGRPRYTEAALDAFIRQANIKPVRIRKRKPAEGSP
jgi:excisionase family DNA binding protein